MATTRNVSAASGTGTNKLTLNKRNKVNKSRRESGSLKYGKISDRPENATTTNNEYDYRKMQNIRVIARFRPPNKRETRWSKENNIFNNSPHYISGQRVQLEPALPSSRASLDLSQLSLTKSISSSMGGASSGRVFVSTLDAVLRESTTQKQVFYRCGLPMIMACLDGYNATIFAYGQSGSGKTYTMMGPESNAKCTDDFGLVPRCIIYLFQKLDERLSQNGGNLQDYSVTIELLQIYKSQLLDLLNPKTRKKLVIKTNFNTDGVFVQNLKSVQIQTVEESFKLLTYAQQNRVVAGHSLNEVSSRSHMLITMTVIQRAMDGTMKTSKLNFGDLAGSEDLTKALGRNPDPERKKEAIAINSSLSALTTAVSYLARSKKPSFRDSPLTHILKDSLGGNSKTVMLVAVSPHIYNRTETIRTLRFASTAKKVKNKAKINEEKSIAALKKRIKQLERENSKLKQKLAENHLSTKTAKKKISKSVANIASSPLISITKAISTNTATPHLLPTPREEDEDSVIVRSSDIGDDEEKINEKSTPILEMKKRQSVSSSVGNHGNHHGDDDDEWDSDHDNDGMHKDLDEHIEDNDNEDAESYEEDIELHDYMTQCNDLRDKLDKVDEENEILQLKVDEKNLELESCGNKIADLLDEINTNDSEIDDLKKKMKDYINVISQYSSQYPSFKPTTNVVIDSPNLAVQVDSPTYSFTHRVDDLEVIPFTNRDRSISLSNGANGTSQRKDSIFIQNDLLANLLTMQQRIETKMVESERTLNEIKNTQSIQMVLNDNNIVYENKEDGGDVMVQTPSTVNILQSPYSPFNNNNRFPPHEYIEGDDGINGGSLVFQRIASNNRLHPVVSSPVPQEKRMNKKKKTLKDGDKNNTLIYESADEKLSEYDLEVTNSTRDSDFSSPNVTKKAAITNGYNTSSTRSTKKSSSTTKKLRKHLYTLSRNEKKLKKDLSKKMKENKKNSNSWCSCFWAKPNQDKSSNGGVDNDIVTTELIEKYLKTQFRKELIKDKIQKNKEKERAKILKKRVKNAKKKKPLKPSAIRVE